ADRLRPLGRSGQPVHHAHRQGPARPDGGARRDFLEGARPQPAGPPGGGPASVLAMNVLGISCFYHDSAAALLRDGVVVAACQEERLSRKKHDQDFPARAVKYVLKQGGIGPGDLDAVGFYDKPLLKFERMLSTYIATFPRSFGSFRKAMPVWIKEKLWVPSIIRKELRPYKGPILFALIMKEIVHLNDDGSFKLNMKYFSYDYGLTMTNGAFSDFFGGPPRKPETWMTEREFDIAASIQKVCEEVVLRMARYIHEQTHLTRLCMAGGVALNCVANGRVIRETPFKELFVQPAAGDAGGSVGVAHYVYNTLGKQPRGPAWTHAYLGPEYDDAEIRGYLDGAGATYRVLSDADVVRETARLIADGNVIGWFQGRMEFGPRALGGRSILADPRDPKMRDTLNMKIKFREGFRPFAPSVLADKASEWFEIDCDSPYMLL